MIISQQAIPMQSGEERKKKASVSFTLSLAEDLVSKYICQPFCSSHVFKRNDHGHAIEKDCSQNYDSLIMFSLLVVASI